MAHTTIPEVDPILEWVAPQHSAQHRGTIWYIVAALVVSALMAYSLAAHAWTFTALIIVISIVYWKTHTNEPIERRMRIYKQGFAFDNTFTNWSECNGYWMLQGKGYSELNIEKKSGARIKIHTATYGPELLHDLLPAVLPELTDRREHVLDTIIRICKL